MRTKNIIDTAMVGLPLTLEQKNELKMAVAQLSVFLKDYPPAELRGSIWDKLYFLISRPGAEKVYSTDRDDSMLFYNRLINLTKSLVILNKYMEEMLFKGYQKQVSQ